MRKRPSMFTRKHLLMTILASVGVILTLGSACGYTLQTAKSFELEKEGIHKIYIAPLVNDTYKSGVENVVFNALTRSLSVYRGITLVQNPGDADAVLSGSIANADSLVNSIATASNLNPSGFAPDSFSSLQVASEYLAILSCSFTLTRRVSVKKGSDTVWSGSFSRSKPFSASNQLAGLGTTSPLINDSEFDRTLADIAQNMMADVREAMLARF